MKKNWFRQFIKKTLVIINAIIAIFFLIGCLLPWLSPEYFWIFGFVGIAMPYLMVLMIFSVLFWLFVKRIFALYFFMLLCLGYKQINVMFAFNSNDTFKKVKANYNIRVISWNVGNMSGKTQKVGAKKHSVDEIVGGLLKQNADVICLQEFEDCKTGCRSVELIKKKYPYYFFPGWIIGPHKHGSGCVIFSKYPILKSDSTRFENGENIITTDIAFGEDTISFFTTHLDSYRFSRKEFNELMLLALKKQCQKSMSKALLKK